MIEPGYQPRNFGGKTGDGWLITSAARACSAQEFPKAAARSRASYYF